MEELGDDAEAKQAELAEETVLESKEKKILKGDIHVVDFKNNEYVFEDKRVKTVSLFIDGDIAYGTEEDAVVAKKENGRILQNFKLDDPDSKDDMVLSREDAEYLQRRAAANDPKLEKKLNEEQSILGKAKSVFDNFG